MTYDPKQALGDISAAYRLTTGADRFMDVETPLEDIFNEMESAQQGAAGGLPAPAASQTTPAPAGVTPTTPGQMALPTPGASNV